VLQEMLEAQMTGAVGAAPAREVAPKLVEQLADGWRQKGYPKVAEHLEENIEDCLACLAFPESHRRRIRTTNGLERSNQEMKHPTRWLGSSRTARRAYAW
jgi:putative transposase